MYLPLFTNNGYGRVDCPLLHNEGAVQQSQIIVQKVSAPSGQIRQLSRLNGPCAVPDSQDIRIYRCSRLQGTEGVHPVAQPCRVFPAAFIIVIPGNQIRSVPQLQAAFHQDLPALHQTVPVIIELLLELLRLLGQLFLIEKDDLIVGAESGHYINSLLLQQAAGRLIDQGGMLNSADPQFRQGRDQSRRVGVGCHRHMKVSGGMDDGLQLRPA